MKNIQKKYPNKLKEHRLRCKLTQRQVSAFLKFNSEDRISRWEQGQAVPNIQNLFKLSILFNTQPQELYPELYSGHEKI